jgi:predicted nuclease with TOPRIM domain
MDHETLRVLVGTGLPSGLIAVVIVMNLLDKRAERRKPVPEEIAQVPAHFAVIAERLDQLRQDFEEIPNRLQLLESRLHDLDEAMYGVIGQMYLAVKYVDYFERVIETLQSSVKLPADRQWPERPKRLPS